MPTTDQLACLPAINNCLTYTASSVGTLQHTCLACASGYYVNEDSYAATCVQGAIENCLTYETNSSTCLACANGYYLDAFGGCRQHMATPNCEKYSQAHPHACAQCKSGFMVFYQSHVCAQATLINSCVKYTKDGLYCLTCDVGYALSSNSLQCNSISEIDPNCSAWNSETGRCKTCKPGFVQYYENGYCHPPFDFLQQNCDQLATTGNYYGGGYQICALCKGYSAPFQAQGLAQCVNNQQLKFLFPGVVSATSIANCQTYSYGATQLVCMQCDASGYVLDSAKNPPCVTACEAGVPILLDNLKGKRNLCYGITPAIPGCTRIARIKITNRAADLVSDVDYACVAYDASLYHASYEVTSMSNVVGMPYYLNADKFTPEQYNYFGFAVKPILKTDSGINTATVANCDIFFVTAGLATPGIQCFRCAFRTHKVAVNSNKQTRCDVLSDCNSNILFAGFPSYLNAALGCHSCTSSNDVARFPYLNLVYDGTDKKWLHYQLSGSPTTWADGIQCLAAPNTGTPVAGCIVYASILTGSNSPTTVCLACGKRLRPTYDGTIPWSVTGCASIDNCDPTSSGLVNGCDKCLKVVTGATTVYYAATDHLLAKCSESTTDNCLIVNEATKAC